MAGFDFQQEVEVVLLRHGARAGDRYDWKLETRAGALEIQVHDTWLQTWFSNPCEAASIIRRGEIDPLTGRWDWHFESPNMDDVHSIEHVLTGLLDAEKEKSLPIMEVLMREFDAKLRAKGRKIKFMKPSDSGELTVTFPMGIPPTQSPRSTTQAKTKLTTRPPRTPMAPDQPCIQPTIMCGADRPELPLVPKRPPDLEDIAFEILHQARYRK